MKDAEKIVVMGGSFNPPTIAHYKLMKDAMQVVKADLGYFVPVSDAYLKRKMRYNKSANVLSPKVRIDMLQCMCADGTMKVSDIEMGTIKARSLETLMAIQAEHPAAWMESTYRQVIWIILSCVRSLRVSRVSALH